MFREVKTGHFFRYFEEERLIWRRIQPNFVCVCIFRTQIYWGLDHKKIWKLLFETFIRFLLLDWCLIAGFFEIILVFSQSNQSKWLALHQLIQRFGSWNLKFSDGVVRWGFEECYYGVNEDIEEDRYKGHDSSSIHFKYQS